MPNTGDVAILGTGIASGNVPVIIGEVTKLLISLGGRGKTKHLQWAQVNPIAQKFAGDMTVIMERAYGKDGVNKIAPFVPPHFIAAMNQFWGYPPPQNPEIAQDVQTPREEAGWLNRLLWLYYMWIGQNIDQDNPESFTQFTRDLFGQVFGSAIEDAGYSFDKVIYTGSTVTGTTGMTTTTTKATVAGNILMMILLIGAVLFFIPKLFKKGAA
jgi:hypothetical protein